MFIRLKDKNLSTEMSVTSHANSLKYFLPKRERLETALKLNCSFNWTLHPELKMRKSRLKHYQMSRTLCIIMFMKPLMTAVLH